ncbi:hypothetical protein D3C73_1195650 [compost metagenome]
MHVPGSITKYDIENESIGYKYKVGYGPVDFFTIEDKIYVSNFEEGSVSIVDLKLEKLEKISLGGMPRGILLNGDKLYIADNFKNKLIVVDCITKKLEKTITLGNEPNAMVYYNLLY